MSGGMKKCQKHLSTFFVPIGSPPFWFQNQLEAPLRHIGFHKWFDNSSIKPQSFSRKKSINNPLNNSLPNRMVLHNVLYLHFPCENPNLHRPINTLIPQTWHFYVFSTHKLFLDKFMWKTKRTLRPQWHSFWSRTEILLFRSCFGQKFRKE